MLRVILVFLLIPVGVAAGVDTPMERAEESSLAGHSELWLSKASYRVSLSSQYESNVLHLKDSARADFDLQTDPGERFSELEEPWDLVTKAELSGGREWKRKKGIRIELHGAAAYEHHYPNRELGHPEFELRAAVKPRGRGRTIVKIAFAPRHFTKNYENPSPGSDSYFRGRRMEYELGLYHEGSISKRTEWKAGVFVDGRDFDPVFDGRDRELFGSQFGLERELRRRLRWSNEIEVGIAKSPRRMEESVEVDRSFLAVQLETGLVYRASDWKLRNALQLRIRDYSTDNVQDFDRYDRRDRRWAIRSKLSRDLGGRQEVWFQLRYIGNSSNRVDGGGDPDIVPYENFMLSLGLEREF